MNIEAIVAISVVCIVLGAVLLIPSLWLCRRIEKQRVSIKLTVYGWLYTFSLLSSLFSVVGITQIYPDSAFTELVSRPYYDWILLAFIMIIFQCIERILQRFGMALIVRPDEST